MAAMSDHLQQVLALRQRATVQAEAVQGLKEALGQEAQRLYREGQVERLKTLKEQIHKEVSSLRGMEVAAQAGAREGRLLGAGLGFALGGLVSALLGSPEHPLVTGLRCAERALLERYPYGNVRAWQIVRECAEKAGPGNLVNPETGELRGVSPHRLRDAFAVHAMRVDDSGQGMRLLQEHLGHASFDTTARYRKVAGEEHRDWYDRLWKGDGDTDSTEAP